MKHLFSLIALLALAAIPLSAEAQVQGQADVKLQYTLPTTNTDGTAIPATGANSLSKVRIFLSLSAIPADVSGLTPTLETSPGTSATVSAFSASVGATIHARLQVCNVAGICAAATNEATGIVTASTPNPAILNTVTITIK